MRLFRICLTLLFVTLLSSGAIPISTEDAGLRSETQQGDCNAEKEGGTESQNYVSAGQSTQEYEGSKPMATFSRKCPSGKTYCAGFVLLCCGTNNRVGWCIGVSGC